jgi:chromosome segregation ATPase
VDAENTYDQRTTKNPTPTTKAQKIMKEFRDKYGSVPFADVNRDMLKAYKRYEKAKDEINSSKSSIERNELQLKILEEQKSKTEIKSKFKDSEKRRETLLNENQQNQQELLEKKDELEQKQQELLEHKKEIQQHIQELKRVLEDKEMSKRDHAMLQEEIENSRAQLLQNNLEVESVRNDWRNMEELFLERQQEYREQTDQARTRAETANTKAQEAETRAKTAENLLTYSSKTNPAVDLYTKFNNKMNQLYVFFKGKIKPNLKSISKMKIEEIKEDIDVLYDNYAQIRREIFDFGNFLFNVNNKSKHKKVNAFLISIEKNAEKIFSDIIANAKAYSSSVQASISGVPLGSGFSLLPNAVLRNMHHNHKYLL